MLNPDVTPLSIADAVAAVARTENGDTARVLIDMVQAGDITAAASPDGELHFRLTPQGEAAILRGPGGGA